VIFAELEVEGAHVIDLDRKSDERGFFARAFCTDEFAAHGLDPTIVQANLASNERRGTVRGLHWQEAPEHEAKTVSCIAGAIFDVVVDVRPESRTRGRWAGVELTAENHRMLHLPAGCAHGYMTLTDRALVFYLVSRAYSPGHERGARWDDPAFGIEWPDPGLPVLLSPKDASWPDYTDERVVAGRS
jgi:dTDP-4-dehydrorhamnose 3,5-epimerase